MTASNALPSSSLAHDELLQTIISIPNAQPNDNERRRIFTRILNQWKKDILPNQSKEQSLEILLLLTTNDENNNNDSSVAIVVQTLLSIINNDYNFVTEGLRESSLLILKGMLQRAFGTSTNSSNVIDNDVETVGNTDDVLQQQQKNNETVQEGVIIQTTLTNLFCQCSRVFQRRMSSRSSNNSDNDDNKRNNNINNFYNHGITASEPMEVSEHIRLLLVELMLDLGGYCLTYTSSSDKVDSSSCSSSTLQIHHESDNTKVMIEASSNVCNTIAKSTFLDPYPEVQRAACDLIDILSQLCPLAVRMNASRLLVPLTGKVNDGGNGVEELQCQSTTTMLSKKCLFRHRHAKTRCKAVNASGAIVMCCPMRDSITRDNIQSTNNADHLSNFGSHSSTMEQILNDTLLPGWEELLKLDSASVQMAVLQSLGSVARVLQWGYDACNIQQPASTMDLSSIVEARVLSMILMCMSGGSVDQVRTLATQQLSSMPGGNNNEQKNLPRDLLAAYFQPMMERILTSCCKSLPSSQIRVRSLETLQVILSIAIPLMDEDQTKVKPSSVMIRSIIDTLSKNILSEEKDVLEAALTCCRILGENNRASKVVLEEIAASMQGCNGDRSVNLVVDDSDTAEEDATSTIQSSPRQMTSILLLVDSMMKGALSNDSGSIVQGIDSTLAIPIPHWFRSSPVSVTIISSLLCQPTVIDNVATNSSLAWALADACHSFVQCTEHECGEKMKLGEDVMVNALIGITYLLSCPAEYGISSTATSILCAFSSIESCKDDESNGRDVGSSLLDVHFRRVFQTIVSSAPQFPWKQSDPAFLAIDALLRACIGSTVGENFDMVAPFFIGHLSTVVCNKNGDDSTYGGGTSHDTLTLTGAAATTTDDLAEEYSLRISLMALLQTVLSDGSFSQTQQSDFSAATSAFSAQFTTDILLSLVLPNLVWNAGSMASSLRKIAVATLFSLLSHYHNDVNQEGQSQTCKGKLHPEMISHLLPVLHSNLEDSESTIRELSCVCLSMVLEQVSVNTFSTIWETNERVIDTLCPRLLQLLDDSSDPVRVSACSALEKYLTLAHNATASSESSFELGLSSIKNITTSLLIQLDDPDRDIRDCVGNVLALLLQLQCRDNTNKDDAVKLMGKLINASSKLHRHGSYCHKLLSQIEEYN